MSTMSSALTSAVRGSAPSTSNVIAIVPSGAVKLWSAPGSKKQAVQHSRNARRSIRDLRLGFVRQYDERVKLDVRRLTSMARLRRRSHGLETDCQYTLARHGVPTITS